jgi:hypothetical protein
MTLEPLRHSLAEAGASGHAVAIECSSSALPVDTWGMAVVVVVVKALGCGYSSSTLLLGHG